MAAPGGLQKAGKDGGRDRDRTCDPYHVNEGRGQETSEFAELTNRIVASKAMMFLDRSPA
ncbi:MAG: hypothetical protein P8Y36_00125 [Alphaproteobacteria bacterium]